MKYLQRKTKNLLIRPLESKDFFAWQQAHQIMYNSKNKWDHGPMPASALTKKNFIETLKLQKKQMDDDKFYDLAVFNTNGSLVGFVSAMDVTRGISHTAFLGYRIFNNYWRQGYGKEAVRAMIEIGFNDLKLHRCPISP